MAFTQATSRSVTGQTNSVDQLVAILAGPLPSLPPGEASVAAAELRRMRSGHAVAAWRHPGWGALVDWIVRAAPECDPTIAAVHAVRNRERALADADYARSLAGYVRRIARGSRVETRQSGQRIEELGWEPAEPSLARPRPTRSLSVESTRLLSSAGVRLSERSGPLIAASVDVAVDWWDGLAVRTGLVGDELVVAARQSWRTTNNQRLRTRFDGPTARPLVALLVGGDQRGRVVRRETGVEAGLLYWSLLLRRADGREHAAPSPPAAVCRAWSTHVDWIERALVSEGAAAVPAMGPTIAA